jgi:hypothetical protein
MKPERVQAIYDELTNYVVELDPDPAARGPGYLQDLISRTRGFLNQVTRIVQEVHRTKHALEMALDRENSAYELSSNNLLATDNRVTRLPNIDDRKAMIGFILIEDRTRILDLQRELKELGFVEKAVKHTQKELDNTMSAIRMQKSLLDTEMRTGAFYGDENDASRRRTMGVKAAAAEASGFGGYGVDDIDAEEFAKLVEEASNPVVAPASEDDDTLASLLGETPIPAVTAQPSTTPEKTPEETTQPIGGTPDKAPNVEESDTANDTQKMNDFLDDDEFAGVLDDLDDSLV